MNVSLLFVCVYVLYVCVSMSVSLKTVVMCACACVSVDVPMRACEEKHASRKKKKKKNNHCFLAVCMFLFCTVKRISCCSKHTICLHNEVNTLRLAVVMMVPEEWNKQGVGAVCSTCVKSFLGDGPICQRETHTYVS